MGPKNILAENSQLPGLLAGSGTLYSAPPPMSFISVTGNSYHFPEKKCFLDLLLFSGFINEQKTCFWCPATKIRWSVMSEIWKNEREGTRSTHSVVEISLTC